MVWNIVASIGGAVLGGIARNKAIKKQNALNAAAYDAERGVFRARFEEIRDDAERGGFNPLTALRSGALSAYGNPSRIPETAQSSVALQAAQAGLQAWAQAPALAREKERFELENQLIRENIMSSQAQREMLKTKSVFGSALTNIETGMPKEMADGTPIVPLTVMYWDNVTDKMYRGPNPEAFEIGPSELATGTMIHGALDIGDAVWDAVKQGYKQPQLNYNLKDSKTPNGMTNFYGHWIQ